MIRPHLEYGVCNWCPFLANYIDMVKRVQERVTRLINDFRKIPQDNTRSILPRSLSGDSEEIL